MHIAVYGAGAIGSTFAYHLSKAGHTVTVVARGERLARLQRDGAIVRTTGETAAIEPRDALEPKTAYDLVLVTVLAPQVEAVLPALRGCAAERVMFMFNTFDSIEPLREAVGANRFTFGFPGGVFTLMVDGAIKDSVNKGTTVGDEAWAKIFTAAKIPTVFDDDMQGYLRAHAALVAPLMSIGVTVAERKRGITFAEAKTQAKAMHAGFRAVRQMGNRVHPAPLPMLDGMPTGLLASMLWAMSRTKMLRDLGGLGPAESRMLIDQMVAAVPTEAEALRAIRP